VAFVQRCDVEQRLLHRTGTGHRWVAGKNPANLYQSFHLIFHLISCHFVGRLIPADTPLIADPMPPNQIHKQDRKQGLTVKLCTLNQ
jgi:hypothetical protein